MDIRKFLKKPGPKPDQNELSSSSKNTAVSITSNSIESGNVTIAVTITNKSQKNADVVDRVDAQENKGKNKNARRETDADVIEPASKTTIPTPSTSTNSESENASWYHKRKLDLGWLVNTYKFLKKITKKDGPRNRIYVICTICKEFKDEAVKVSKNGMVPLAEGIRVDSKETLERVIDHLDSSPHAAADEAKKASKLWEEQSEKHPWVHTLKKHREGVVNDLIALCMDVYNDSLLETPTARTWPSRSLTALRTKSIQAQLIDAKNWDVQLDEFQPPASTLHYRDPVVYAEMLEIIGDLEKQKAAEEFKSAICISLQIDGSVDRRNKDMKFVVAKFISKNEPTALVNRFIGVVQSESTGAQGLLDATLQACKMSGVPTELLVGVTTDGEAANTGREGGLWKLLEDHLEHKLLTVWCFCHRSDLAMESALAMVPELKHWLSNTTAVSTYFRTAPTKWKRMQQIFPNNRSYPAYFEVRFSQHVHDLISAVLHNLPGSIQFWHELSNAPSPTSKIDKATAEGMLKIWDVSDSLQLKQTCLMADITLIMQDLQKNLQKGHLILPDVLTLKNNALRKLRLILEGPFPGGEEEKLNSKAVNTEETNTDEENEKLQDKRSKSTKTKGRKRRKIVNSNVTTGTRAWPAIRNEIVSSFINFLDERLNIEENDILKSFSSFLNSKTSKEMIDNGRLLISNIFGDEKVSEFASNVCDCWPKIVEIEDLDIPDSGVIISHKIRKLIPVTTGILQKLICALFIISPHSMTVEKVISHYNQFKSLHRMTTSDSTINSRMVVALNGIGTAFYDPRPAVSEFLKKKERRYREPDLGIYSQRDFVQKFFRHSGAF